jgi:hypothetical protein
MSACSCGCTEAHIIARRTTADGIRVEVWSDGTISQRGFFIRGLGTPRSAWAVRARTRAARLMLDELELYDVGELPRLIKIAARTFAHTYSSEDTRRGHVRALFASAMLLLLTACGPDSFYMIAPASDAAPDALETSTALDAADERTPDADAGSAADAADAACETSGGTECADVVTAYCTRYAACCQQFPSNGNCQVGFGSIATCKQFYTQNGYDCSSGKYTRAICTAGTSCEAKIGIATCGTMFSTTGPNDGQFATCPAFWSQF